MEKQLKYNEPWILQRADPYVYRHTDGTYYFTASVPEYDRIVLRSASHLADLADAEEHEVWHKHESGPAEHPYLGAGTALSLWKMVSILCRRR